MLRDTILAFAERYDFEEGHSLQDERLALRLFDETARLGLHDLHRVIGPVAPRDLLSCAALLHDIGYVEGYEAHHKTALRLILQESIEGLSARERAVVAHTARYHRSALPDLAKHADFAALTLADRTLVTQLGAILRLADGLDRAHRNAVADLQCERVENELIVRLLPGRNDTDERWAGQKKARWFESVFQVTVVLK